jgi:hypothetical protein
MRRRPVWLAAAAVVAGVALLVLAHRGGGEAGARQHVAMPTATPALPDSDALTQATGAARAFLDAYADYRSGDTPEALRARLRPYDTDRLDAILGQGAASGEPGAVSASVADLDVLGLAPDGRLVIVAQLTWPSQNRYVELYLASTPSGWRVDEVAL